MNFQARAHQQGTVTIVELKGRLTFEDCNEFRCLIEDLIRRQHRSFLLDLRGLEYLDSSGIGELVRNYCSIRKVGGDLKVIHLTPKVEEVLRITNSCFLFEDYADEEAALRSFRS